jgi:hypothetical protein
VIGFCCTATKYLIQGWKFNQRIEVMFGTAFFFVGLAVLVAAKCGTRIAIDSSHFDGLPRPSQLD